MEAAECRISNNAEAELKIVIIGSIKTIRADDGPNNRLDWSFNDQNSLSYPVRRAVDNFTTNLTELSSLLHRT